MNGIIRPYVNAFIQFLEKASVLINVKSYKPNKYMMPILNQQHFLAEQFHAKDILIIKANYEATLKIKRWKFIHSLTTLSTTIRKEADNMIQNSFLSFIDSQEVLITEGFFDANLQN